MKILFISPTQKGIGGIAQFVKGLSDYLTKAGHEVDIISSDNTFTLPVKGLKNPSFMISSFLKTKFKKGYDIVHAHHFPSALAMKNVSGKKILTIHGIYSDQIDMLHGKTASKLSSKYEKDALTWADAITAGSMEAHDYYTKLGFKIHFIPNAIDIGSLPTKIDKRFEKQIIYAGRLSKEKGTSILLEIAKKLPQDVNLVIVGSGPKEQCIIDISQSASNIHFLGYQPKNITIPLIRGSDLLIQPSFKEGISSTLIEAMACRTPIVTTNVGGNRDLLSHNETGILVESGSYEKMLKEILEILDDKPKRERLAEAAFSEVQKYDWSKVGRLFVDLYNSLLK